ncbi:MAG: hypothetical protein LPH21_08105 [Shewanella sp.]|nr:hypothetical protein [Shewanella sp.]MCF1457514.1 hypothetical protein [Shewanella sp.]
MTTHHSWLLGLGLLLVTIPASPATKDPLPLDTVLDANGDPIAIPQRPRSALELPSPEFMPPSPTPKKNPKVRSRTTQKLNRKQQLANRDSVANDPTCRWLDQRLKQLESAQKQKYGYQQDEYSVRFKEWQCLKCGAEGPGRGDHDKCQTR